MPKYEDEYKIPKLSEDNYHSWSIRCKAALVQRNTFEAIEPGFGEEMTEAQTKTNQKALTFLFLVVEDSFLDDIADCTRAQGAWKILEDMNSKHGLLHTLQLMRDFFNVKIKPNEDMRGYLSRVMELHRKLKMCNYQLNDREVALVMLMGLNEKYEALIVNLKKEEESLTTKDVKSRLLVEEKRHKRREDEKSESSEATALISTSKMQHINEKKSTKAKNIGEENNFEAAKIFKCFCCGKMGHIARNCRFNQDSTQKKVKEGTTDKDKEETQHQAFMAWRSKKAMENVWFLDSGTTDHMSSVREKFSKLVKFEATISTATSHKAKAIGVGPVHFQASEEHGGWNLTFTNTLYVPELEHNLLSVSRITQKGFQIIMQEEEAVIINPKTSKVVLIAKKEGNMYYVAEKEVMANFADVTAEKWHQRLGHLNFDAIKSITGERRNEELSQCEVCIQAKMKALPVPKKSLSLTTEILELIHSDVEGKIKPTSRGGSNYYVSFIDDFSRYVKIYPMKLKSEVFQNFLIYKAEVENLHRIKIKGIQTDGGGENSSNEMEEYLNEQGIIHRKTVPRTPSQNGVAERQQQTLLNNTRCMLIQSGVPKYFWADAAVTAAYLRNKSPTSALNGKCPEEVWFKVKVERQHLRTFGCLAWALIDKECRNSKLDPVAERCVLIGYPPGTKGYKLWNLEKDQIIVRRNVIFHEDSFPCFNTCKVVEEIAPRKTAEMTINLEEHGIDLENEDVQIEDLEETEFDEQNPGREICLFEDPDDDNIFEGRENLPLPPLQKTTVTRGASERDYQLQSNLSKSEVKDDTPRSLTEALNSKDKVKWTMAMHEELKNFEEKKTWTLVRRPNNTKIIGTKWIFKKKMKDDGTTVDRFRARLVAQGFDQTAGVDYQDKYSPVMKLKSLRILLALSVELNWDDEMFDVVTAYLNGVLEEVVYVKQPPGFSEAGKEFDVYLLHKGIYGLPQSGREWYKCLDSFLRNIGLKCSKVEPCIYYSVEKKILIGVYVDDLPTFTGDKKTKIWFKEEITKQFNVRCIGPIRSILSIQVIRGKNGEKFLHQKPYINEVIESHGNREMKSVKTPLELGSKFVKTEGNSDVNESLQTKYKQLLGSLIYVACGTRPDIMFATAFMGQFCENPSQAHWNGLFRILRYLMKTEDYMIQYKRCGRSIAAYSDADFGSDLSDRKSFSGYVFILAGGPISWSAKKQKCTALSTVEAEYIAMTLCSKEVLWITSLIAELKICQVIEKPFKIGVDNTGAEALAKNRITSERNKHIDIKYFFLRDLIEEKKVSFYHIDSANNVADLLTKKLSGPVTLKHVKRMGIIQEE